MLVKLVAIPIIALQCGDLISMEAIPDILLLIALMLEDITLIKGWRL
jgi:hypothetical protein